MIKISVVTPNGEIANGETDYIAAKIDTGEIGFLKDHSPMIARISDGYVSFNDTYIAIYGGILDLNNNVMNVVCQYAIEANSLEDAHKKLNEIRNERLQENKRKMVDFALQERELIKNIKEAKASNI